MIKISEVWTPRQVDFDAFALVSGDDNAIHVAPDFCAGTAFGRTVSHGMLLYSRLWGMLKRHSPAVVAKTQSLMFPNPAFADEALKFSIWEPRPGDLNMRVVRLADGAECLIGEAAY